MRNGVGTSTTLGERLRAARSVKGLTQAQLAGPEYSVAYVSRIESGERTPSPEALAVLAKRLGTSPEALLSPVDQQTLVALEGAKAGVLRAYEEGDFVEARTQAERLLELARSAGIPHFIAFALRYAGEAIEHLGEPESAIDLYRSAQAEDASPPFDDRLELIVSIARAYRLAGDLGLSADLLERAVSDVTPVAVENPALAARVCMHLAITCYERGDIVRARQVSTDAVRYAQASSDRRALANALWVAAPPMAAADPARALSLIRRAGTLFAELGNMTQLGRLYLQIGRLATQIGDRAGARAALEHGMSLIEDAQNPLDQAKARNNLAELELADGNLGQAHLLATEALELVAGADPQEQANAHATIGRSLVAQSPEAAERELRAAVELFISVGAQTEAARCFRSLGDLLVAQGRRDEALAIFREGLGAIEGAA